MAGPGDDDDSERLRDVLAKTRIAPDLLAAMRSKATRADPLKAGAGARYTRTGGGRPDPTSAAKPVIIEFNDRFPSGSQTARWVAISAHAAATGAQPPSTASTRVLGTDVPHPALTARIAKCFGRKDVLSIGNSMLTRNYLFGRLSNKSIAKLAASEDGDGNALVHKIWFDHPIQRCVMDSVRTIKCDAARTTFAAAGKGIVWAVADTGVDGAHPHLTTNKTLEVGPGLAHRDFTQDHPDEAASSKAATTDIDGHGTHVAGIIAGASPSGKKTEIHRSVQAGMGMSPVVETRDEPMYGLAPMCKILSLKVLRDQKDGSLSALLAALGHLQTVNDHGRDLRVHGLNLSLGYPYDPEWFAAGQSPLCRAPASSTFSAPCSRCEALPPMDVLGQSPFAWLELDKDGSPTDAGAVSAVAAMLADREVGDLVVMAHGWKNDRADAKKLYGALWEQACKRILSRSHASIAVCGVLWPAKAFRTEIDGAAATTHEGATFAAGGGAARRGLSETEFETMLADVTDLMGEDAGSGLATKARAAAADSDRERAISLHGDMVDAMPPTPDDPETSAHRDLLSRVDAKLALDALRTPPSTRQRAGAAQGASGVGEVVEVPARRSHDFSTS